MASLIEELITTLRKEKELYESLIPVSEQKTKALIQEDLKALQEVTDREQVIIDQAYAIGKKREGILSDIGIVLNKDPKELELSALAEMLSGQPEESGQLREIHDSLKKTMQRLVSVNERNKSLIENSLEMIEFNMNFIQSTRMSPGSNNYNRNASSDYGTDAGRGAFDARQ